MSAASAVRWVAVRFRGYRGRTASRARSVLPLTLVAIGTMGPTGPRLGPYEILMFATPAAPGVQGRARLVFADSPFGIAFTADGHARYDVEITAAKLPAPSSLGNFSAYLVWATTPDLSRWERLGSISNGTTTVGSVDFNKFLLVVTAEHDSASTSHGGPTVLHGTSPSGWMQQFLTQPEFHGVN
jgi:hypothetical protein